MVVEVVVVMITITMIVIIVKSFTLTLLTVIRKEIVDFSVAVFNFALLMKTNVFTNI